MNNKKILIILIIGLAYSTTIDIKVNVIPNKDDIIYKSKMDFKINSQLNIYALRFNLVYDISKIKLHKNKFKFDNEDVRVYVNGNDSNYTEILVIGDNGDVLVNATNDSLTSFMGIDFSPINNYAGNILVDINNLKIFGYSGVELNHNLPSKLSLQLSFIKSLRNMLYSNAPNPFRYLTKIKYELSDTSLVYLTVTDFNGGLIDTLINKIHYPDKYTLSWYAMDENNNPLPSGNYILSLDTDNYNNKIKMVILK